MEKLFHRSFVLSFAAVLTICGFFMAGTASANVASATLDGSASGSTSGSAMTINLTTSKTNDLLYLSVVEPNSRPVVSVTSSPALTWTQRKSMQYGTSGNIRQLETWYTVWPSNGSINITVNFSGGNYNKSGVAFGISGANTNFPFDGDSSVSFGTGVSASTTVNLLLNDNDFIVGTLGVENNSDLTTGTGFNLIKTQVVGSTDFRQTSDEYEIVSSPQLGLSAAYSWTKSADWAIISDAIEADTNPPGGGSINYTSGYFGITSVPLTVNDGTDAGSGVDTSSRIVQRKSASMINGSCADINYGSFATIKPDGAYPNFIDNNVSTGNCYMYQYLVSDKDGNTVTYISASVVKIDTIPPTVTINNAPPNWTNATTPSNTICTDDSGGVGCDSSTVNMMKVYSSNPTTCSTAYSDYTFGVQAISSHVWVCGAAKDMAGNIGFSAPVEFKVDQIAPSYSFNSPTTDSYYVNGSTITVDADIIENDSGIKDGIFCQPAISGVSINGGTPVIYDAATKKCTGTLTFSSGGSDGSHQITLYVPDIVGNSQISSGREIMFDNSPPTTTNDYGAKNNVWQNTSQTITLTPFDATSGVASTKYCIDSVNTCDPSTGTAYTVPVIISSEGKTYFRYASTDNAGNVQPTVSEIVKIDKTAPTLAVVTSPGTGNHIRGSRLIGANASDGNGSGIGKVEFYHSSILATLIGTDTTLPYSVNWDTTSVSDGPYSVWIIAYDNANNQTTSSSVNVIIDNTAPVITLAGTNPATVIEGDSYTDAGASATDNIDASVTVVSSGTVNMNKAGNYTIIYTAKDIAGNVGTATRTVNVVDQTAPVIKLVGDSTVSAVIGSTYTDAGATAIDNNDGDITANIKIVNPVDTNTIGQYEITYDVSDAAGNPAIEVTRTVNVVPSNLSTLNSEIVIAQEDVASAVVGNVPGNYTQASVDALNSAITSAQTVTDTQSQSVVDAAVSTLTDAVNTFHPVGLSDMTAYNTALSAVTQSNYTTASWSVYEAVVSANQKTNQDSQADVDAATSAITTAQANLVAKAGLEAYVASLLAVHQSSYTADSWATYQTVVAANVVTDQNTQAEVDVATANIVAAQSSLVLDTIPPAISGLSDDLNPTKSKTWTWSSDDEAAVYRFAIDQNSEGSPSGDYSDIITATQSSGDGTYYLHVQAKDAAGNESSVDTVSAILDNTAPVLTLPANITSSATDSSGVAVTFDAPTATDAIDGSVAVTCNHNSGDNFPVGDTTVHCGAIDTAGNSSQGDFTITVNLSQSGVSGTNYFTINSSADATGSISPNGATSVVSGSNQTYNITPDAGYQVGSLLIDGVPSGTPATYTFNNITAGHSISVTFLAVATGGGGGGGGGGGIVTTPTATATAKPGDANGDGVVDEIDFSLLMAQWGQTGSNLSADFNHDGTVDELDFSILMANWS
jgi:hypothetical protein